jgi:hypothetical protein
MCPIALDLMQDPVMDAYGHTFERSAIERVLVNRPGICPLTNTRYPNGDARLTLNRAAREMMDEFNKAAGESAQRTIAIKQHNSKTPIQVTSWS